MQIKALIALILTAFICGPIISDIDASKPVRARITDLTERQFAVNWITQKPEIGKVLYGLSPSELNNEVYDIRSQSTKNAAGFVHQVRIDNLSSGTTYYFKIISGGETYPTGDRTFTAATTASLEQIPGLPRRITGYLVSCDKQRAVMDALVTAVIKSTKGDQSLPRAFQVLKAHPHGLGGAFSLDLSNARSAQAPNSLMSLSPDDQIMLEIDGPLGRQTATFNFKQLDKTRLIYCGYGERKPDHWQPFSHQFTPGYLELDLQ